MELSGVLTVEAVCVFSCLFLRCRAWELAIGGSRLASLLYSLLTISSNNLIDNDSRISESVGIPALSKV